MIYRYSIPRSGSALMWNILSSLYPGKVVNLHSPPRQLNEEDLVVIQYRNPLDSIMSFYRVTYPDTILTDKRALDGQIRTYMKWFHRLCKFINETPSEKVLLLKYEKFAFDFDYTFDCLEKFFSITIRERRREKMKKKFNLEAARKIADQFEDFSQYDHRTHLHGHHIYNGQPGNWKTLFDPSLHQYFQRQMKNEIEYLNHLPLP